VQYRVMQIVKGKMKNIHLQNNFRGHPERGALQSALETDMGRKNERSVAFHLAEERRLECLRQLW
jgi:hypothetical protein